MAAVRQRNVPPTTKRSIVQKSQPKKTTSQQPPTTKTINPKEIKPRFENQAAQNSMNKPSSISRRKQLEQLEIDSVNGNYFDWRQPSDLKTVAPRKFYSPVQTPPRLRALLTPPGLEPYYNSQNIRRFSGPLPSITGRYSPPVALEAWGFNPATHDLTSTVDLMRRYPSPLSHLGLGTVVATRPKKPYVVVPRLNNFVSPPVSRGGAYFVLPKYQVSPLYNPNSKYIYLNRIDSFSSRHLHREASDYVYLRSNEAFANQYIDDFIARCIEDEFIPDILLEIIAELEQKEKRQTDALEVPKGYRHYPVLTKRIKQDEINSTQLQDKRKRIYDNRIPPDMNSNRSLPAPKPQNARLRFHDLPADVQGRLLADINQELIDFELGNVMTELSEQSISDSRTHIQPIRNESRRDIQREIIDDRNYDVNNNIDKHRTQYNAVKEYAEEKYLDTICLDESIRKYRKQNTSAIDYDDGSRLLDGTVLENLIDKYQDLDEKRSIALNNYA